MQMFPSAKSVRPLYPEESGLVLDWDKSIKGKGFPFTYNFTCTVVEDCKSGNLYCQRQVPSCTDPFLSAALVDNGSFPVAAPGVVIMNVLETKLKGFQNQKIIFYPWERIKKVFRAAIVQPSSNQRVSGSGVKCPWAKQPTPGCSLRVQLLLLTSCSASTSVFQLINWRYKHLSVFVFYYTFWFRDSLTGFVTECEE